MIIDTFLTTFPTLREYADSAGFEDVENAADGVTYPQICEDIPAECRDEVLQHLAIVKRAPLTAYKLFMRLSPAGVDLLKHRASGIAYAPEDDAYLEPVRADQNNQDAWDVLETVPMAPNRAFIFDARRFHRAEPVGGFGFTPENARLVLTCFFS